MVSGKTIGTNLGITNVKNFNITEKSKSFPANSDMYNQIDCNKRINIIIIKSGKNVFTKVVKIYRSRIFTRFLFSDS